MTREERLAALLAAALAAVTAACGFGGGGSGSGGGGAGMAAGRAVVATFEAAAAVRAPWRCALPRPPAANAPVLTGWRRDGDRLVAEPARPRLTLAAVGQARGAAVDLRADLRAASVDVVLALGGMGASAAELKLALAALVDPSWLVVALPGDREAWPAHAAAIAELAAGGAAIVDGASLRVVDGGAAVVATLPGEPWAERLGAGVEGCAHDAADIAAALALLAEVAADRPRVLVTPPAPQGGASDVAPGGLHAGEPALGQAVAAAQVDLVIHGPVDGTPAPAGNVRRGTPVALAAGSLDPVPRRDPDGRTLATGALLAVVDGRSASWRFLPAPALAR